MQRIEHSPVGWQGEQLKRYLCDKRPGGLIAFDGQEGLAFELMHQAQELGQTMESGIGEPVLRLLLAEARQDTVACDTIAGFSLRQELMVIAILSLVRSLPQQ